MPSSRKSPVRLRMKKMTPYPTNARPAIVISHVPHTSCRESRRSPSVVETLVMAHIQDEIAAPPTLTSRSGYEITLRKRFRKGARDRNDPGVGEAEWRLRRDRLEGAERLRGRQRRHPRAGAESSPRARLHPLSSRQNTGDAALSDRRRRAPHR